MQKSWSDIDIKAYLDGAMAQATRDEFEARLATDLELQARVGLLDFDVAPLSLAYDALLEQAPHAQLSRILAESRRDVDDRTPGRRPTFNWQARNFVALAASLLVAIGLAGWYFSSALAPSDAERWRQAVADYQALYVRDTLAPLVATTDEQQANLQYVSKLLGLDLPEGVMHLQGADFKRGQILGFDSKPLAQITYLYGDRVPIAFCIVALGEGDAAPELERRTDLNIVHWSKRGYSFMLIGDVPNDTLSAMARGLREALG